jgi:mannosyltransferase
MNDVSKKACSIAVTIVGALMLVAAALISGNAIERFLIGGQRRTLLWGPSLFRGLLVVHGLVLISAGIVWLKSRPSQRPMDLSDSDGGAAANRTTWMILIALTVLALGLRIWKLNSDLWLDEVLTLTDFARPPFGEIITSFPSQNQHMLYSVLAHASISIFGESAWALRLPSVLFGVGSLWALFLLGRSIIGRSEALLACGLMTASYHHIWFSQNARGYMGLLFFAILSTWLWIEAQFRSSRGWWIGYLIAVPLGMWIHMTMVFVVLTHVLLLAMSLARKLWAGGLNAIKGSGASSYYRPLIAFLLCTTITLQLYALSLPEFLRDGLHEVSLPSEWTNPLWVLAESLRSLQTGFSGAAVVFCAAAMVAAGWLSIARRNLSSGLAIIMPALLAAVIMSLTGHNLWPRFFFFSMGFALMIVVHGATTVPRVLIGRMTLIERRDGLGRLAGPALAGLLVLASTATVPRCYALPKQDFSGARDYVETHRGPDEPVVAVGLAGIVYGRYFAPQWLIAQTGEELKAARRDHSSIWLVYTLPIEVKAYRPELWNAIESDFKTVKVFPGTLGSGEVYVCHNTALRAADRNPSPTSQE